MENQDKLAAIKIRQGGVEEILTGPYSVHVPSMMSPTFFWKKVGLGTFL